MHLPSLASVPEYQAKPLIWRKIRICCTQLDLQNELLNNEIRMRYDTIQELIDTCNSGDGDFFNSPGTLDDCFRMLAHILFRPLPVPKVIEYNPVDMVIPFLDPDWEYIELVHEFLLKLVFPAVMLLVDNLSSNPNRQFAPGHHRTLSSKLLLFVFLTRCS